MRKDPPIWASRFFAWFCHQANLEGLEGDLYELFDRRVEQKGFRRARWFYLWDMLSLMRPSVARPFFKNSKFKPMDMLKNYLRTALRLGWKRKSFSAINLVGLTLGITSVLFIAIYVIDELGYDRHIPEASSKYRIYNTVYNVDGNANQVAMVSPRCAPELKANFPQVVKAGRVMIDYGGTVFRVDDQLFSEKNGVYAEKEAMDILDIQLVAGNLDDLNGRYTMIVSQSLFRKFFGDVPFDAQTVQLGERSIQIAGIYEDIPDQSHFKVDYILAFDWLLSYISEERMNHWFWQQFYTYVQLDEQADFTSFEAEAQKYITAQSRPHTEPRSFHYIPQFQNIRDVHLKSNGFSHEMADVGSFQSILFLSIAAVIILFIACLNYINLTTAMAIRRAKEVGIRKFVGATRMQLLSQYAVESTLYCLLAGLVSSVIFLAGIPSFNAFTGKDFPISEVFSPLNIAYVVLALIVLGLISGWYPALVITRFQPISTLSSSSMIRLTSSCQRIDGRKLLVTFQYIMSIGLIVVSLIVQNQYRFLRTADMGFDKENLMVIPLTRSLRQDLETTKNAFRNYSNIEDVTLSYGIPGGMVAGDGVVLPRLGNDDISSGMFIVDANYLRVMGMEIIAGRDFSEELASDVSEAFILNESAVRSYGLGTPEEAIGETVHWNMWRAEDTVKRGKVIGVVRDFNYRSLHNPVESAVLHIDPENFSFMIVKIGDNDMRGTLEFIEQAYRQFEPQRPFEYEFVDQSFAKFYEKEELLGELFAVFTLLAIFTAAIGLYGLMSFSIVSRGKEISIRKVLGANTLIIFRLLVRNYFLMVGAGLVIAFPIAYVLTDQWLDNFAYRVNTSWQLFVLVTAAAFVLTLLTIGYQAIRGARANPALRLRSD